MNRRLTVLFAAAEALLVVAVGVAIPLLLLTILWAVQFGFGPDWAMFARAAADLWLLGHGVDVTYALDPPLAAGLGVAGASEPFRVTIALLGFALLTVLLGVRAGGRIAESGHPVLAQAVAVAVVAVLGAALAVVVWHEAAAPSRWQAAVLPAAVFAIGLLLGVARARAVRLLRDGGAAGALQQSPQPARALPIRVLSRIPAHWRALLGGSVRTGLAAVAGLLAIAAVLTAATIAVCFAPMIGLYESLHSELLGGVVLTAGQLALLPNLVVWAASWLVGPGFAVGAGSSVSPLGTVVGPLPAVPVLGAIPADAGPYAFLGLIVPVAAAFLAAAVLAPGLIRAGLTGGPLALTGVGGAVVGGLTLGVLAWASGGSAGPGRLAVVGPDPVAVGAIVALEFAIGAVVGFAAATRWPSRRGRREAGSAAAGAPHSPAGSAAAGR